MFRGAVSEVGSGLTVLENPSVSPKQDCTLPWYHKEALRKKWYGGAVTGLLRAVQFLAPFPGRAGKAGTYSQVLPLPLTEQDTPGYLVLPGQEDNMLLLLLLLLSLLLLLLLLLLWLLLQQH